MTSAPSWALSANGVFSSLGGGLGPAALALWGGAAAAAPLGVKDFSLRTQWGHSGWLVALPACLSFRSARSGAGVPGSPSEAEFVTASPWLVRCP